MGRVGTRPRALANWMRAQQAVFEASLRSLAESESPSRDREACEHARDVVVSMLKEIGYAVRVTRIGSTAGHVLARRARVSRRAGGAQLLLGHYDTVWPRGTLAYMPYVAEPSRIRGPGVFDMKGGIVEATLALRALDHFGLTPPLEPVVFLNCDEETGSRDSGRYVRMLARRVERVFVLEPALGLDGRLKTVRKAVGRYTVTVTGRAAHAGLDPEAGASAILELAIVIQKLFDLNDSARGITVNVGTIEGGLQPNVVAPESRAVVDLRVMTSADALRIDRAIRELAPSTPGTRIEVEGGIGRPPLENTRRNRALWLAACEAAGALGIPIAQGTAGGGSDGSTTSQFAATLDGLGAVGDGAHASHEHLDVERTLERAALLAMLLMTPRLAGDGREAA